MTNDSEEKKVSEEAKLHEVPPATLHKTMTAAELALVRSSQNPYCFLKESRDSFVLNYLSCQELGHVEGLWVCNITARLRSSQQFMHVMGHGISKKDAKYNAAAVIMQQMVGYAPLPKGEARLERQMSSREMIDENLAARIAYERERDHTLQMERSDE